MNRTIREMQRDIKKMQWAIRELKSKGKDYCDTCGGTCPSDIVCKPFYKICPMIIRVAEGGLVHKDVKRDGTPHPKAGLPIIGSAVYSVSRNQNTHWVQLLVDDNAAPATLTAIEARINGLKDNGSIRVYEDDAHNSTPMETPRHFTLDRVLRVRQAQKDGTLGRIEDVKEPV